MAAPGVHTAVSSRQAVVDLRVVGGLAAGATVAGSTLELGVLCPLRGLTGIPCPLCGLTTGVAEFAHGDLAAAMASHPLAVVAVAVLLAAWTPLGPSMLDHLRRRPSWIGAGLAAVWVGRLAGLYGS